MAITHFNQRNTFYNLRKWSSSALSAAGFFKLQSACWHHERGQTAQIFHFTVDKIKHILSLTVSLTQWRTNTSVCKRKKLISKWRCMTTLSFKMEPPLQPPMRIMHKPNEWLFHAFHPSLYSLVLRGTNWMYISITLWNKDRRREWGNEREREGRWKKPHLLYYSN